jgi:hypothetical protein
MAYKRRTSTRIKEAQTRAANADAALNNVRAKEKALATLSSRMLATVGVQFGKDSNEYEQAGGTHTSEIQRSPRSPEPPA